MLGILFLAPYQKSQKLFAIEFTLVVYINSGVSSTVISHYLSHRLNPLSLRVGIVCWGLSWNKKKKWPFQKLVVSLRFSLSKIRTLKCPLKFAHAKSTMVQMCTLKFEVILSICSRLLSVGNQDVINCCWIKSVICEWPLTHSCNLSCMYPGVTTGIYWQHDPGIPIDETRILQTSIK